MPQDLPKSDSKSDIPKRGLSFQEFVERLANLPIPPTAEVVAIRQSLGEDWGFVQDVLHSDQALDGYPELLVLVCEFPKKKGA